MSEDSGRISFPKLNDTNYGTWSLMMEAELTRKSLFLDIVEIIVDFVDAKGAERSQEEMAEEIAKKKKARKATKMAEARAEMILRVEPSQLAHMRDKDPLVVWEDLRAVHRARGFATSVALRKRFLSMKMKKGQLMVNWIGEVKTQAFEMQAAGISVSDHDQILALTTGLPPAYKTIITTFGQLHPSMLTLDYVIIQLLNEEVNINADKSTNSSTATGHTSNDVALAAISVKSFNRCYACGSGDHLKRDCPLMKEFEAWKKSKVAAGEANAVLEDEDTIAEEDFAY